MGKHFNQQTWREHEQQSRRQPREDDDQREQQYDEFDESPPPRGFSDFYGWKIKADVDHLWGPQ